MSDTGERSIGAPAEGWTPVILVAILGAILSTVIDEPAWVNGRGELTDGLIVCAMLGALVGFGGPKLGWGRWTTHLVGALLAGLLVPILAGWAMQPGTSIPDAFRLTADGTAQAYLDLAWRGRPFTTQEVHYVLVLGGLVWGTMQFAAYAVFGHRRPFAAVIVVGLVLLANMALTRRDQLGYLVGFAGASLFLLVQMHAFDERSTWARRRIGDPSSMSALYLRGGTLFIVVAMAISLVLTQRAASSPLAGAWGGVDTQLVQVGEAIGRLFPVGGDLRGGGGVAFGSVARIAGQWFSDDGVAFTAKVPAGSGASLWRAATYDTFSLAGWEQSSARGVDVAAGDPLLAGTAEDPVPALTTQVEVTVTPQGYHDTKLLAPGVPTAIDRPATVLLAGPAGWYVGTDVSGDVPYTVQASVLLIGRAVGVTGNQLRAASQDYPEDVTTRYTAVPTGAIGPDASALLQAILARSPSRNPYDLAMTMQDYLRSDRFTYTTDVRGVACTSTSAVECFARTREGYCLHYASTMAILLRAADPQHPIPTRLVQGFLPGTRAGDTETVRNRNAHAWVEVYFPGYGWIPFDPTGGVGLPSQIQDGPPVPVSTPTVAPAASGLDRPRVSRRPFSDVPGGQGGGGGGTTQRPADSTIFGLLAGGLALLVLLMVAVAWWRGPRGEVSPESAWSSLARAASRFGFAPRPTQTVYEYAASLGDLVPVARTDLGTVADAKVETTYARTELTPARIVAVRDAMRRLRISMARLLVRRLWRRGRRR